MKKSILLGVASLAVGLTASYGQGYIALDNYGSAANPLITYGAGVAANGISGNFGTVGAGLNSSWTVGLYFVGGTTSLTDPAGNGIPIAPLALGGITTQVASSATFGAAGEFSAASTFYTGSATFSSVTLEIVAYDSAASSYETAAFRGHSAPFTMPTAASTAVPPVFVGDYMSSFSVTPVPEPTTLALAGLGGFGMLMALRRKKA